ncbi:MAG TPA: hypothetical protein VGT79_07115 [Xanthomonadaceae bacterium]|nr:hypothetical protein [Xanthomonadaceae bacterium]
MTFGVRRTSRIDPWIAPGTALCFSILVAVLGPRYATWFGASMPDITRRFIDLYPAWIAITALALVVQACVKTLQPGDSSRGLLKFLDEALSIVSILILVVGLIAFALPVLGVPSL